MATPTNGQLTASFYAVCMMCQAAGKVRWPKMTKTAYGNYLRVVVMTLLAAVLVMLAGAKPAVASLAGFPDRHDPIAFEKDGDIWVATRMHLAKLTPNTAHSNDVDPSVSPDGRYVAFASDRDGDFEIYTANVFTGEEERLTDNAVYDYNPGWSFDGERVSYIEPLLSPQDVRIFSLRTTHAVSLP
jgi:dipeptidyl aminopeptidase/acylaminoacyl peptidase